MINFQSLVREFNTLCRVYVAEKPSVPSPIIVRQRLNLTFEEFNELVTSTTTVEEADAYGDLGYILCGNGLAYGVDVVPVPYFAEPLDLVLRRLRIAINEENIGGIQAHCGEAFSCLIHRCNARGWDYERIFSEVHRSNMTKLWRRSEIDQAPGDCSVIAARDVRLNDDGRAFVVKRREDDKVIKSPSYERAKLAPIINNAAVIA